MNHRFRERLKSGELLVGTIVTLGSPEVAELLTSLGFDWLFIDAEHSTFEAGEMSAFPLARYPVRRRMSRSSCSIIWEGSARVRALELWEFWLPPWQGREAATWAPPRPWVLSERQQWPSFVLRSDVKRKSKKQTITRSEDVR